MATVTGLTADRMLEIEAESVIDGDVVDGELILTKHDGSTINAGSVVGPAGPEGPIGSDLEVLIEHAILDIGILGQIRAGRTLEAADFDNVGLDPPTGLWNFSDNANDVSGNGRNLSARGAAVYVRGIDGDVSTAAMFDGTKAFYRDDVGDATDPFRLKFGSFGAWIRTPKQGTQMHFLTKRGSSPQLGYWLRVRTGNDICWGFSVSGSDVFEVYSLTKVCDDRWHFIVGTYDGVLQNLYIDGALEATQLRGSSGNQQIFGSNAPFNIGAFAANAGGIGAEPFFGRVDEPFVTPEILSADKVFNLYCAKIPHTLGEIPSGASINVHPGAKGASLVPGDFPSPPLRLYNFSGGVLTNEGSDSGATLTAIGTPVSVSGVDGTKGNAMSLFGAQRFTATDAGLPAGTNPLSYGCWFKCSNGTSGTETPAPGLYVLTYGATNGTNDTRIFIAKGNICFGTGGGTPITGPFVADGQWHFVVVVHDPADLQGLKRKYYLDGRLVASNTGLNSIALGSPAATNKFVVGSSLASGNNFIGQVDTVFVADYPLILGDINALYTKSLYEHLPSPKNAGDHIQSMSDTDLLAVFDTLDIAHKVSLKVMA